MPYFDVRLYIILKKCRKHFYGRNMSIRSVNSDVIWLKRVCNIRFRNYEHEGEDSLSSVHWSLIDTYLIGSN